MKHTYPKSINTPAAKKDWRRMVRKVKRLQDEHAIMNNCITSIRQMAARVIITQL